MRINLILLFLILLFSGVGIAQEPQKEHDHQIEFYASGGLTSQLDLRPKFGYLYGINYTVRNQQKHVRLSVGGGINHYRTKTHDKHISYFPQSDTFYVLHWNNVFYEFQIKLDFIVFENYHNKFYFSLGWNYGSYIKRERTTKYFDESQNDKLISETTKSIGQPIDNFLLGRVAAIGFERRVNERYSYFFSPNLILKGTAGSISDYVFVFFGLNTGLKINL